MRTDSGTIHAALSAVCPILDGTSLGKRGDSSTIQWTPSPDATAEQIAAAQALVDGWDWSPEAEAARETQKARAETVDGFASKDRNAVAFRALAVVLNAELNAIRVKVGLPTRTVAQAMAAFQFVVESGTAD